LMRHRARELLAGQRTAALHALRPIRRGCGSQLRAPLRPLICQIDALDEAIGAIDKEIEMSVKPTTPPSDL
jgi:hypothetical protein